MIKEFAQSLGNRGHFLEEEKVFKMRGGRDKFMSLFCYDDNVKQYFKEKNKIAGYNGLLYLSKEHILDVDGETFSEAKDSTLDLLALLEDLSVPFKLYFSGRGFHISIDPAAFMWEPNKELHKYIKDALDAKGIFKFADSAVTDKIRLIRCNNTINSKSGLYKVDMYQLLRTMDLEQVEERDINSYANKMKKPQPYGFVDEIEPVFDALPKRKVVVKSKALPKAKKETFGREASPINYPCIQDMLKWSSYGKRHSVALRLASWFRWRYPETTVRLIMEDWRKQVSTPKHPFEVDEMESIIKSSYDGHDGNGNNYGCNDSIREQFCKETCRLYAAKKNSNMLGWDEMEDSAINFYANGIEPLNLGGLYNTNFPIYPGELVVIQAPPKSMKTMLVHNWIINFKKPTYFLEMEMSARQMHIRHRQIREDLTFEEVEAQLRAGKKSEYKDDWLIMDYKPCYPFELDKRINIMSKKPEIVVVDHIGLMESNNKDMNGKMEEIMASLKDVAIRNNIIVFAISEMTKESMNTKNGVPAIAAARGSARIGYTANKLLQIKPFRKSDGSLDGIKLECIANREREGLYAVLKTDKCRLIMKEEDNEVI